MLETKKFQKKVEDFICENCGAAIKGTGYTDHCPHCLYSKHVDLNPGDRASHCKGSMKPIGIETKGKECFIHYQCLRCGHKFRVKSVPADNFERILELVGKPVKNN